MIIKSVTVGPLEENCWILVDETTKLGVLVDPGDEPMRILRDFEATGATLQAIWLTHGHFDHIGGIAGIRKLHPKVPIHLHTDDQQMYAAGSAAAGRWGVPFEQPPAPDHLFADGAEMTLGELSFTVHHVPGHSAGQVMFVGHGVSLSGDLLFKGSIGRTDLPGCDPQAMQRSLERAAQLDPAIVVYPGHGPTTTIGRELLSNPFLSGMARVVGA